VTQPVHVPPAALPAPDLHPGRGLSIAGFWAVMPGAVLMMAILLLNNSMMVLGLVPYLFVLLPAAFIGFWLALAGLVLLHGRHTEPRSGAGWGWAALIETGVLTLVVLGMWL
jgi:hypothetical protein